MKTMENPQLSDNAVAPPLPIAVPIFETAIMRANMEAAIYESHRCIVRAAPCTKSRRPNILRRDQRLRLGEYIVAVDVSRRFRRNLETEPSIIVGRLAASIHCEH